MSDDINKLREMLFETMRDVRAGKIDIERAKMINDAAQTIVNSAKVEVDFIRTTGSGASTDIVLGFKDRLACDQTAKNMVGTTVDYRPVVAARCVAVKESGKYNLDRK